MGIEALIAEANKSKVPPIVLVVGDERLLVTQAVDAVRAGTVGAGPRGFNEDHFDANSASSASVADAARSLPMMGKVRLVLVRNADAWKAADWDELIRYAEAPSTSTVLLLLAEKLNGSLKFVTNAKRKGWLFEAKTPDERDLGPWIDAEARRRGIAFERGAAESLLLSIGADLGALADALERLQLFAGSRAITDDDVEEVIKPIRESGPFELSEAVADKDLPRCLSIIDSLSRAGNKDKPALVVLALVARQVRMLALARDGIDKGGDGAAALNGKMPPFAAKKLAMVARNKWSAGHLFRALKKLSETDGRLKSSSGARGQEWRVMEELVLVLCA
ncbi:MAG: DNA polymerase III subunit delta [Myxococcales bacterium]|nr:DNA polymerase III subunit delta [Myxococcales bacterium]